MSDPRTMGKLQTRATTRSVTSSSSSRAGLRTVDPSESRLSWVVTLRAIPKAISAAWISLVSRRLGSWRSANHDLMLPPCQAFPFHLPPECLCIIVTILLLIRKEESKKERKDRIGTSSCKCHCYCSCRWPSATQLTEQMNSQQGSSTAPANRCVFCTVIRSLMQLEI